mmetsp:Transcript_12224/g.17616  ORF Transcript_12224/g.17616 Transcript_12224/m.17616 type:complete len:440 (-) Transcript_12224:17-1336(-)
MAPLVKLASLSASKYSRAVINKSLPGSASCNCFSRQWLLMSTSSQAGAQDGVEGKKQGARSSSNPKSKKSSDPNRPRNPQDFVKIRFEPGEWDALKTDPLYLPSWNSKKVKIISEEDFVNRPTAGFSEEFASLADARITFSWMNQDTKDMIYQDYLGLMEAMNQREKVTSHEYVVNVIAQKYKIMPDRVAAIVQLAHNEERIKVNFPEREIHYEFSKKMDERIQRFIQEVYAEYNEVPPDQFVEDVLEYRGKGQHANVEIDDLYDLDELSKQAIMRDRDLAQSLIDTKVYIEDYDPSQVEIKVNQECRDLIKSHDEMKARTTIYDHLAPSDGNSSGEEQKKGRSIKFVAQTINTLEMKKKNKNKSRKEQNTIVEQDGKLRVATQEELESMSWKSKRNVKEFMLRGVKKGWLDRNQKGITTAWGRTVIEANKSNTVAKVE